MIEELISRSLDELDEIERKLKWDRFLDAYSDYLGERSPVNAALLKLAGTDLERADGAFSMEIFQSRIGWNMMAA